MARAKTTFTLVLGATLLACGAAKVAEAARPTQVEQARTHKTTPLVLSSVVSRSESARSEAELREDLADALDVASFDGVPAGRKLLLSATLEVTRTGGSVVTTSTTIELAIVEGASGRIIGVVRGKAAVEAAASDTGAVGDAVRAAAKGAVDSAVQVARTPRP